MLLASFASCKNEPISGESVKPLPIPARTMPTTTTLHIGLMQASPAVNPCALQRRCTRRGFAFDAAQLLCAKLNFTCLFSWYNGTDYGDYDAETNMASGLVGAIHRGEFDTSVPILTPTYSRTRVLAFSNAYYYSDVILATRSPEDPAANKNQINWNLLYAFQWPIWMTVFSTYLISCLVIVVVMHLKQRNHYMIREHKILAFLKISLYLVTRQYSKISKRPNYVGVMIAYWALAFVVLTGAYTGALFSQKLLGRVKLPFNDIRTFLECLERGQCTLIVSTLSNSALQTLALRGTEFGDRLHSSLEYNPVMVQDKNSIPDKIQREKSKYLVWLVGRSWFDYYTNQNENCRFLTVDTPYRDVCAFGVRKNSSDAVLRMINLLGDTFGETGVQKRIESDYYGRSDINSCNGPGGAALTDTSLVQFADVIVVLGFFGAGIVASILIMVMEMCLYRCFHMEAYGNVTTPLGGYVVNGK